MGLPAMTKGASPLNVLKSQFVADVAYSNKASTDFYEKLQDLEAKKKELELVPTADIPKNIGAYSTAFGSLSSSIAKLNRMARKETDKEKLRKIRLEVEDYMTKANKYLDEKNFGKLQMLKARLKVRTKQLK